MVPVLIFLFVVENCVRKFIPGLFDVDWIILIKYVVFWILFPRFLFGGFRARTVLFFLLLCVYFFQCSYLGVIPSITIIGVLFLHYCFWLGSLEHVDYRKLKWTLWVTLLFDLAVVCAQLMAPIDSWVNANSGVRFYVGMGASLRPSGVATSPLGHQMFVLLSLAIWGLLAVRKQITVIERDCLCLLILAVVVLAGSRVLLISGILMIWLSGAYPRSILAGSLFTLVLLLGVSVANIDFAERMIAATTSENRIIGLVPGLDRLIVELLSPILLVFEEKPALLMLASEAGKSGHPDLYKDFGYADAGWFGGVVEFGLSKHVADFGIFGLWFVGIRIGLAVYILRFWSYRELRALLIFLAISLLFVQISTHNSSNFIFGIGVILLLQVLRHRRKTDGDGKVADQCERQSSSG